MLSKITLKHLLWAYRLASFLHITSLRWDGKKLVSKNAKNTKHETICFQPSKVIGIFNIMYRVLGTIVMMLNLLLRSDIKPSEVIFGFYTISIWIICTPIFVFFLLCETQLMAYTNTLIKLNVKMSKMPTTTTYVYMPNNCKLQIANQVKK
jgi:hypothetical protein